MWAVQYIERYEENGGVNDILAIFNTKEEAETFGHLATEEYKKNWYNKGVVTIHKLQSGYNKDHWLTERVLDKGA